MKSYQGRFNHAQKLYDPPELENLAAGHPVTVDGVAIRYCWYADTQEGIAKRYIKADGKPGFEKLNIEDSNRYPDDPLLDIRGREGEPIVREGELIVSVAERKCIMSVTHRGKVEIWGDEPPQRSA